MKTCPCCQNKVRKLVELRSWEHPIVNWLCPTCCAEAQAAIDNAHARQLRESELIAIHYETLFREIKSKEVRRTRDLRYWRAYGRRKREARLNADRI